jgi:hypothetical protein
LVKACPTSSSFVPSRIVMIRCSKSGSNGLGVFASVMFAEMSASSLMSLSMLSSMLVQNSILSASFSSSMSSFQ